MTSRHQIPQWTWYNGKFLFQFNEQLEKNPEKTIKQFFDEFLVSQSLDKLNVYHTKNQGTVILLLYGLLVIPKELWEETSTNFLFQTKGKFKIIVGDNNLDTLGFLRKLRNSIAHANFEIDTDIDTNSVICTFWNTSHGKKNFEVEICYSDLGEFMSEVGKYYINEVQNSNTGTSE